MYDITLALIRHQVDPLCISEPSSNMVQHNKIKFKRRKIHSFETKQKIFEYLSEGSNNFILYAKKEFYNNYNKLYLETVTI